MHGHPQIPLHLAQHLFRKQSCHMFLESFRIVNVSCKTSGKPIVPMYVLKPYMPYMPSYAVQV